MLTTHGCWNLAAVMFSTIIPKGEKMWEAYIGRYKIFSDTFSIYLIGQNTLCYGILAGMVLQNKTEVL